MKTDDDTFVRLDRLVKFLETSASKEKYYGGITSFYSREDNKASFFYLPEDQYPRPPGWKGTNSTKFRIHSNDLSIICILLS